MPTKPFRLGLLVAAFGAGLFGAASAGWGEPNRLVTVPLQPPGSGTSSDLRFDRDGRFAVFTSSTENLIPGQSTAGLSNVFLYDRIGGGVRLVSHVPGVPTTGGNASIVVSAPPQISADGRWVVFTSAATDLVAGQVDTNAGADVFLWNRLTDSTQLVSRRAMASPATAGNEISSTGPMVTLSDDGRYVVFASLATDLVAGQNPNSFRQVYQFDRTTGLSVLVSHNGNVLVSAAPGSDLCTLEGGRAISADGRFVVFRSEAILQQSGTDPNFGFDIFLWDRDAGLNFPLVLLSRSAGNPTTAGNQISDRAAISGDGNFVVFGSLASDLEGVTSDTNGGPDVFRYDRRQQRVELVSHRNGNSTTTGNGASTVPVISFAGDQIAFQSGATNLSLLQNDSNGADDVFLWRGNQLSLVSHSADSVFRAGNGVSRDPVLGDGAVGFRSLATDLVSGISDGNGGNDVFYRPPGGGSLVLVSHTASSPTTTANAAAEAIQISFGGALLALQSAATDLVDEPVNSNDNLFHHGSLVMANGFETGDLSAWSQHLP